MLSILFMRDKYNSILIHNTKISSLQYFILFNIYILGYLQFVIL